MRKFLKNIIVFSLLTAALFLIGEIVARSMPSSYSYKHNWILKNGDHISTLILGSSHTYYGLRPNLLGDSVFNLANVSQTPEYDLYLLKTYLPCMPNLKRIIFPVSYFTYSDPAMEKGDEWRVAVRYKTQMNLPVHSDISIYNLEISDFEAYCAKLKNLVFKSRSNQCDSLGFGLGFDLANRNPHWKETARERAEGHTRTSPGRFDEAIHTQETLIELASKNGIETVIVTTPGYEGYTNSFNPAQYEEMKKGVRLLVKNHAVKYYDFMNDSIFRDNDFYDPDHLSDVGASRLSLVLADSLKSSFTKKR